MIALLAAGERSVTDIAAALRLKQPEASKQLGVLRSVGLVEVRGDGRKRLYALRPERLKPIHDWVLSFARFWAESHDRLDEYLERLQSEGTSDERGD